MTEWDKNEEDAERGMDMASISEDFYYATHDDPLHPMSEAEKSRAIRLYQSLISTQNQKELNTSEKAKL